MSETRGSKIKPDFVAKLLIINYVICNQTDLKQIIIFFISTLNY